MIQKKICAYALKAIYVLILVLEANETVRKIRSALNRNL